MITHRTYRIPVEKGAASVFDEDSIRRVASDVAFAMAESEGLQHVRESSAWRDTVEGIDVVVVEVAGWLPPTPTATVRVSHTFDPSAIPPDDAIDRIEEHVRRKGGWT